MKKLIMATLLLSGLGLKAQHDISTDVLGFAFSKFGFGYEYALNNRSSVGLYTNFTSKNLLGETENFLGDDIDYFEFNVIPEYKFFLTPNKGNDGVYAGVYGKYRVSSSNDNPYFGLNPLNPAVPFSGETDVTTSGFALGALIGYKWRPSDSFFVEVTGGIGNFILNSIDFSDDAVEDLPDNEFDENDYIPFIGNDLPVDLRIAVRLGLSFGG